MAKDTRIFRVTKAGYRGDPKVTYHTRTAVSGMFGTRLYSSRAGRPDILKVEAANAEATSGWTDVTDEFRNPRKPDLVCSYHKHYTGVRQPVRGNPSWYGNHCKCWAIYCAAHPEYPTHSDFCGKQSADPDKCDCKVMKKIFG